MASSLYYGQLPNTAMFFLSLPHVTDLYIYLYFNLWNNQQKYYMGLHTLH